MFGARLRKRTEEVRCRIARFVLIFVKNPNTLTLSSLLFAAVFAAFHTHHMPILAWISMLFAYLIDTVDGSVARILNKATKWGNYLDAMVDKYVEAIIYIGLGMTAPFPALLAALGSLIESYAKPRTAMVIPIDNHDWPAIGERVERCAIIALGYGIYALTHQSDTVLNATLYAVAIITWIGSVQRVFYAKRIIEQTQ